MIDIKKILESHQKWLNDEEGGERADLRYADLRYADLRSADLRFADLRSATGNLQHLKSLFLAYTAEMLQIGCERHSINEWFEFDNERIEKMDRLALAWWAKYRDFIKQAIELSPAEPTGAKLEGETK